MDPRLRLTLVAITAGLLAVFLGAELAQGFYLWPALVGAAIIASILIRFLGLPGDTIFLGFVLVGYLVGNRGFAQLMPARGVPLLPAEAALLFGCTWRLIQCSFQHALPFRKDALNWAVLAWLLVGTTRVVFDVPVHGINAIRDYATVYYAVLFFLVQHMAATPAARRHLIGCLLVGVVALIPMYGLFNFFERFFVTKLVVAGTPLIFYKGDLVATHLAAGSLLLFHWAPARHRWWAWTVSSGIVLFLLAYDSRAALLGWVIACGLLLIAGRWRYPALQGAIAAAALLVVVVLSTVFENAWADRKVDGLVDRLASFVDISGGRRYQSEESYFKGDNNRFRVVWWRNVIEETTRTNPVFGLGFGADLAHGFVQEYFPDATEEFNTRSPHNLFLTAYGRMGALGVGVWLSFCVALLGRTWRSLRHTDDALTWSLWCGAWVILVSATFGVVLEGPMGAVIFWTLLGLASVSPTAKAPLEPEPEQAAAGVEARGVGLEA